MAGAAKRLTVRHATSGDAVRLRYMDSGSSNRKVVEVQVLSSAPNTIVV